MLNDTLSKVDIDDLYAWLSEDGLNLLLNALNEFFEAAPILHQFEEEALPKAHIPMTNLRIQLNTFQAVRALLKLKESLN